MNDYQINRPYTTVVLAMSADGKIADQARSPARFSSLTDKLHLEKQIATSDAVLFGAGTLRAYGTTLSVTHPELLAQRKQQQLPPQPIQIVVSRQANIDPQIRFFRQPVPRWLLTTLTGEKNWQQKISTIKNHQNNPFPQQRYLKFDQIIVCKEIPPEIGIDWISALTQLANLGLSRIAVLGGGELVAALMAADLIDEFWLTVCPLILGGATAPTPVAGLGFSAELAPRLQLLSVEAIAGEVFLQYRLQR